MPTRREVANTVVWTAPVIAICAPAAATAASPPQGGTISPPVKLIVQDEVDGPGSQSQAVAWTIPGYSSVIPAGTHITGITIFGYHYGGRANIRSDSPTQQLTTSLTVVVSGLPALVADNTTLYSQTSSGFSDVTIDAPTDYDWVDATLTADQFSLYANDVHGSTKTTATYQWGPSGGSTTGSGFGATVTAFTVTYTYAPN